MRRAPARESCRGAHKPYGIGEHGSRPGARITLVDEETGETLTEWPGVVSGRE
jgi:hypothetical protein